MMNTITKNDNSIYSLLTNESKRTIDELISLLYSRESADTFNEETEAAMRDTMNRENLTGPFDNIDDFMVSLNA